MKIIDVKFPLVYNFRSFLDNSSYLNVNGKIYISGGSSTETTNPSNQFLFYDQNSDSIRLLTNMREPRHNHSMIYFNNKIYIIGGEFTKTTEIYDLEKKTLENRNNNHIEAVDNPTLWVHKNFLYSFLGKKNGEFVDYVQRVNLNADKFNWEKIPFKLDNRNLNIKLTNCAIVPFGDFEIFFFGGKCEKGINKQVFSFNFETKEFKNTDIILNNGFYFNNSSLMKFEKNNFCGFSANEKENMIRISTDLNEY